MSGPASTGAKVSYMSESPTVCGCIFNKISAVEQSGIRNLFDKNDSIGTARSVANLLLPQITSLDQVGSTAFSKRDIENFIEKNQAEPCPILCSNCSASCWQDGVKGQRGSECCGRRFCVSSGYTSASKLSWKRTGDYRYEKDQGICQEAHGAASDRNPRFFLNSERKKLRTIFEKAVTSEKERLSTPRHHSHLLSVTAENDIDIAVLIEQIDRHVDTHKPEVKECMRMLERRKNELDERKNQHTSGDGKGQSSSSLFSGKQGSTNYSRSESQIQNKGGKGGKSDSRVFGVRSGANTVPLGGIEAKHFSSPYGSEDIEEVFEQENLMMNALKPSSGRHDHQEDHRSAGGRKGKSKPDSRTKNTDGENGYLGRSRNTHSDWGGSDWNQSRQSSVESRYGGEWNGDAGWYKDEWSGFDEGKGRKRGKGNKGK